jgi:uncharacterized membrane protein YccF (DUF307 family)
MRTLGNLLWLLLAGIWLALGYVVAGILNLLPIITIPFSIQSFKLAGYALWPFGRVVVHKQDRDVALSALGNVIWIIISGFWLAIAHLLAGLLLIITVVGAPLGLASIKMAGLALLPFGKKIVPADQARDDEVTTSGPAPIR